MNKEEKAKLWADRIQQYKTSGQTCKQWCAENDIPLSTMGYWTRRLAKEDPASEPEQDLVFARLPSEREAARKLLSEETAPVRIFVSDSIYCSFPRTSFSTKFVMKFSTRTIQTNIDHNFLSILFKNF